MWKVALKKYSICLDVCVISTRSYILRPICHGIRKIPRLFRADENVSSMSTEKQESVLCARKKKKEKKKRICCFLLHDESSYPFRRHERKDTLLLGVIHTGCCVAATCLKAASCVLPDIFPLPLAFILRFTAFYVEYLIPHARKHFLPHPPPRDSLVLLFLFHFPSRAISSHVRLLPSDYRQYEEKQRSGACIHKYILSFKSLEQPLPLGSRTWIFSQLNFLTKVREITETESVLRIPVFFRLLFVRCNQNVKKMFGR